MPSDDPRGYPHVKKPCSATDPLKGMASAMPPKDAQTIGALAPAGARMKKPYSATDPLKGMASAMPPKDAQTIGALAPAGART